MVAALEHKEKEAQRMLEVKMQVRERCGRVIRRHCVFCTQDGEQRAGEGCLEHKEKEA